jgi:2-aminoethylphosphonate-pyruvate transaminase
MHKEKLTENPYLLLTPGPLTTTSSVKAVMLCDWCTWDRDYNGIVQDIRRRLTTLATSKAGYTSVLMQGSGTYCIEATLTTSVPDSGKLLVLANGEYGKRMAQIAERCRIPFIVQENVETEPPDLGRLEKHLKEDKDITHVAVVHCETTTGMLNPIGPIGELVRAYGKTYIVDAMSSFAGIPLDMADIGADFLVSSANKCIQGVPGFGFIVARQEALEATKGNARSLSLDVYDQWKTMENHGGKWRFTSPTHVVRAFAQALDELEQEGGIQKRYARYCENYTILVSGMQQLGFMPLLRQDLRSPIITAFHSPEHLEYSFPQFYQRLKQKGFVIYPGKVTQQDTFRIGNIGDIHPMDIHRLIEAIRSSMYWKAH